MTARRLARTAAGATAPPINRGTMAPVPWRGFWNSLAATLAGALSRRDAAARANDPSVPWQRAATRRRRTLGLATGASTLLATALFAQAQPEGIGSFAAGLQVALFALLSAWITSGSLTALMGCWVLLRSDAHSIKASSVKGHALDASARTAIVMPICNEDVASVFAGLRATCESVAATGHARAFDVFVLSDSSDPAIAAAELAAWEELRAALAAQPEQPQLEVYYRLRHRRTKRKAGNVADFCRRWGRDYRYMVVLDADSVMSGDCIVTLAKLMEAHPQAGILQTATQAIGHATAHARAQQFSSRVTGRLFTLGMQYWQLGESHYWGHNAIIRLAPFMQHCALAPIRGRGGLAGDILSHDFVEAALMRRAGWQVWLVPDLVGSYEQQPPDLLSELQRDRRWCQGNLQNARLIAEPGIHPVHRAMFGIGAMSYVAAPLWLGFLALGALLWAGSTPTGSIGLIGWGSLSPQLQGLWVWTLLLLFLPRVLGLAAVLLRREQRRYGGTPALLGSAVLETFLALLQAPVRMLAHSLFVAGALTGLSLAWKSPPRSADGVAWRDASLRLAPMVLPIAALAAALGLADAAALAWLAPVGVPLLLAVPLAVLTGDAQLGARLRGQRLLLVPEETWAPPVLRQARRHALGPLLLAQRRLQAA